jgi:hypothetical protein
MLPPELDEEMKEILYQCMLMDPFFDPSEYECQSFALQILLARQAVRQRQTTQVKYEVISSAPYTETTIQDIEDDQWLQDLGRDIDEDLVQDCVEYTEDAYAVQDLLSLVSVEVPLQIIETWSDKDISAVCFWAGAVHLRASDHNDVKIPKMPKVLKPYKK